MLDDVDSMLKEAKAEIAHNLELVNCLRKMKRRTGMAKRMPINV